MNEDGFTGAPSGSRSGGTGRRDERRSGARRLTAAVVGAGVLGTLGLVAAAGPVGASSSGSEGKANAARKSTKYKSVKKTWKDGKDLQKDAKVVDATQNSCALYGSGDASTYLKAYDFKSGSFKLKRNKVTITVAFYGPWVIDPDSSLAGKTKSLTSEKAQKQQGYATTQPLESQVLSRQLWLTMYANPGKKTPSWGGHQRLNTYFGLSGSKGSGGSFRYGSFLVASTKTGQGWQSKDLGAVKAEISKNLREFSVSFPLSKITAELPKTKQGKQKELKRLALGIRSDCGDGDGDVFPGGTAQQSAGGDGGPSFEFLGDTDFGLIKTRVQKHR